MNAPHGPAATAGGLGKMGGAELVALVAALMALNALAIDIMLPALPSIGATYALVDANELQRVVLAYVLGLGVAQLVAGPLGDRFGRRPVLLVCLLGYAATGALCLVAPSFGWLLAARAAQGAFAAGPRTLAISLVRDLYVGPAMARTMSLVMMVFMIVPILAPGIGQAILKVAPWTWTFGVLVVFGLGVFAWLALRLPETLDPAHRRPFSPAAIAMAYGRVLRTRDAAGYTLANGLVFGVLFAYLSSSEQLFGETYDARQHFGLLFAAIAVFMSVSSFLNARLVERVGVRGVSHRALVGLLAVALLQSVLEAQGLLGLGAFVLTMGLVMACFGLIGPNFTSLAMQPVGDLAGTASAVLGFSSTTVSALLGGLVAQRFDGSAGPIVHGYAALALATLVVVLVLERGRLARPDPPS
ncbi:MAG: multidrug effflux MFS transporter [Myxococcota bacterium]